MSKVGANGKATGKQASVDCFKAWDMRDLVHTLSYLVRYASSCESLEAVASCYRQSCHGVPFVVVIRDLQLGRTSSSRV